MQSTKKFLLVCEGPTDIEIIKSISSAISSKTGKAIDITPLSPQQDQTTGIYPSHGWTEVRTWCIGNREKTPADVANAPAALRPILLRKNWKHLVSVSGAEGLIIQIDTDIAEEIRDLPYAFNLSGMSRRSFTEAAVLNWLALPTVPTNSLFLVLSTYSTEAWILACHEPTDPIFSDLAPGFSYEDLHDVEQRLIGKGLTSKKKRGRTRLDKTLSSYQAYGVQIVSSLPKVRSRCSEADSLCSFFESI